MITMLNTVAHTWWVWVSAMFWQVGLLIVLVACVDRLIRRWAWPHLRYALWSLILIKLILPPTLSLPSGIVPALQPVANQAFHAMQTEDEGIADCGLPIADSALEGNTLTPISFSPMPWTMTRDTRGQGEAYALRGSVTALAPVESANPQSAIQNPQLSWYVYAMAIWLAGTLTLGLWLLLRLNVLAGRRANFVAAASLPQSFYNQMAGCAKRLGLRRIPRVVVVGKLATPAVFGILRPVLLMPQGYLRRLTRQDTEHMLLHELAHIKRGDLHMHALYMLVQIVYWYNPLLWLVRRQLHHLRELSCDATVAELLRERTTAYRQTLLETARRLLATSAEPGLGLLGLFEDSNRLAVRLHWLEKPTWRYRTMKSFIALALAAIMFACVLPMAQGQDAPPVTVEKVTPSQDKTDQSAELEELKAKIEKLELERHKLQQQLVAQARARASATQAASGATVQAAKVKDQAAKAREKAAQARLKARATHMNTQQYEQWAQQMQAWQKAVDEWKHSDAFIQWEKDMKGWTQRRSDPDAVALPADAPAMPQMPPMPQMPVMPSPPDGVAVVTLPTPSPTSAPASAPARAVAPAPAQHVELPHVVVPEVKVPRLEADLPMPQSVVLPQDGEWVEAKVEGQYVVKSLRNNKTFIINNQVGSVTVMAGEGSNASVKTVVTAKGISKEEAEEIARKVEVRITPKADGDVILDTAMPEDIDQQRREKIQVAFEVVLPAHVLVNIRQKVGNIRLVGLFSKTQARTDVGNISAENVRGYETVLRTNVGSINMVMPDDVSAEITAATEIGTIKSDFDLNITGAEVVQAGHVHTALGSSAAGVVGDEKSQMQSFVKLETNVGSIQIRSADQAK